MYKVKYIDISLSQAGFVLFLAEEEGGPALPLVIGISEAHSISLALNRVSSDRPLSHDLFHGIMNLFGSTVIKVIINRCNDKVYFSELYIKTQDGVEILDSRPSDAVALALRFNAPIYIDSEVMSKGAQFPERENSDDETVHVDAIPKALDEVTILKAHLADAVAKEKYEEAALIRDKIQKLEEI